MLSLLILMMTRMITVVVVVAVVMVAMMTFKMCSDDVQNVLVDVRRSHVTGDGGSKGGQLRDGVFKISSSVRPSFFDKHKNIHRRFIYTFVSCILYILFY